MTNNTYSNGRTIRVANQSLTTEEVAAVMNAQYGKTSPMKQYYIWNSVDDESLYPEHAVRDGKVFSLNDDLADGHPGQADGCTCSAKLISTAEALKLLREQAQAEEDKASNLNELEESSESGESGESDEYTEPYEGEVLDDEKMDEMDESDDSSNVDEFASDEDLEQFDEVPSKETSEEKAYGINPRGDWNDTELYMKGDLVRFDDATYLAVDQMPGQPPQGWQLIASDKVETRNIIRSVQNTIPVPDKPNFSQVMTRHQSLQASGSSPQIDVDFNLGSSVYLDAAASTGDITLSFKNLHDDKAASYIIEVQQNSVAQNIVFPGDTIQAEGNGNIVSGIPNSIILITLLVTPRGKRIVAQNMA